MSATKELRKECPYKGECFRHFVVSLAEWRSLKKYARELDIETGHYYDGRIGAINFWCGPKDKPKDWPGRIRKGYIKYAREYVGLVQAEPLPSGKYRLHLEISAYARADNKNLEMGSTKWREALQGTALDREWLLEHFKMLRQHAKLMRQNKIILT